MGKVHIFYYGFVSDDGTKVTLGGVQTLLINLTKVFNELGYEVHYYKPSTMDFESEHYNIKMHGHKCAIKKSKTTKRIKDTFNHFKSGIDPQHDIILFADDLNTCKTKGYRTIALQHGIFWDIPCYRALESKARYFLEMYRKIKELIQRIIHSRYVDQMVCVDYNYVNWYRSTVLVPKTKMTIIPNFAPLFPKCQKPKNVVNIMFARRFEPFRGTRVFCAAITRILEEYDNVHVTLAGWGSDEKWLHERLDKYGDKVEFTTYNSEDTFAIHSDKHIAVVPTVGSEGTSLSLLEAMSSQCAVIGSDVGGITNILLDGYNGMMVPAGDSDRLYEAMKYLVDNPQERERMAVVGYETIAQAFSYDIWKAKWVRVMKDFVNN